jgi:hypothetical protein
MTELERQFLEAITDLRATIDATLSLPWYAALVPPFALADYYGRREQVRQYEADARTLVAKWGASKTDDERRALVRRARDLAKNAREVLHGGDGATTYAGAVRERTAEVWDAAKEAAAKVGDKLDTAITVALVAAGVVGVAYLVQAGRRR